MRGHAQMMIKSVKCCKVMTSECYTYPCRFRIKALRNEFYCQVIHNSLTSYFDVNKNYVRGKATS